MSAPRKGIRRWGFGLAAALTVVAGIVFETSGPPAGAPEPAVPSVPARAPGVPWHTARIDRTGTRITVYAAPLPGKCVSRDADDDRADWSDGSVALFLAGVYEGCADDRVAGSGRFELPQALDARTVLDARDPAGERVVFREADLPDLLADGWNESPATWADGGSLTWRHDRPGRPGVTVTAGRWDAGGARRGMVADHELSVAGRTLQVYAVGGLSAVWFSAGERIRFTIRAVDATIGKSRFDAVLRDMTWS